MNMDQNESQKELTKLINEFKDLHKNIKKVYNKERAPSYWEMINPNVITVPEIITCKYFKNDFDEFRNNLTFFSKIKKSELNEYECQQYALLIFIAISISWKEDDDEEKLKERFFDFANTDVFPENIDFFENIFNQFEYGLEDEDKIFDSLGRAYVDWYFTDEKDVFENIENYILNCQQEKNYRALTNETTSNRNLEWVKIEKNVWKYIPSEKKLSTKIKNNRELELWMFMLLMYKTTCSENNPESLSRFETFSNSGSIFINHYASPNLIRFIEGPFKLINGVFLKNYEISEINKLQKQEEIKSILNNTIEFFNENDSFSSKDLSEHPGFLLCFSQLFCKIEDLYLKEFFTIDKYNSFYDFRLKLFQNMFFIALWNLTSELYFVIQNKFFTYNHQDITSDFCKQVINISINFYTSISDKQWKNSTKQAHLLNSLLKIIGTQFSKKSPELRDINFTKLNGTSFESNLAIYKILINLLRFTENQRDSVYEMAEFAADQQKKILPLRPERNSLFYDEHSVSQELDKLYKNKSTLKKIDCGFNPEKVYQFESLKNNYNEMFFRKMIFKLTAETDKIISYSDEYFRKDKENGYSEKDSKKFPRKIKFTEEYRQTNKNNLNYHYIYTNDRNPDAHSSVFIQIEKLLDQENARDLLSAFYDARNTLNEIKKLNKNIYETSLEKNKKEKLQSVLKNIQKFENKLNYLFGIFTFKLVDRGQNPWTEIFDHKGQLKTGKKGNEILDEMDYQKDFGDEFLYQIQLFFQDMYYLSGKFTQCMLPQYAIYLTYEILKLAEYDSKFSGLDFNFTDEEKAAHNEMFQHTRESHKFIGTKIEDVKFYLQIQGEKFFDNISNPEDIVFYQLENVLKTKKMDVWKMLGKQVLIRLYNWQNLEKLPAYIKETQKDIFEEARKINKLRTVAKKGEYKSKLIENAKIASKEIAFTEFGKNIIHCMEDAYYFILLFFVNSEKTAQKNLLWTKVNEINPIKMTNPIFMVKKDAKNKTLILSNPYDIIPIEAEIILDEKAKKVSLNLFNSKVITVPLVTKNLFALCKLYVSLCENQINL